MWLKALPLVFVLACVRPASSVLEVQALTCGSWNTLGTAVAVPDGVLTAHHVPAGEQAIRFCYHGNCVLAQDGFGGLAVDEDWAFYPDQLLPPNVVPVSSYGKADIGDPVVVYGYALGAYSVTSGAVTGVADYNDFQFDARVLPGNSGGPVFSGDRLVGIVYAMGKADGQFLPDVGYATDSEWIRDQISQKNHIPIERVQPDPLQQLMCLLTGRNISP